MENNDTAYITNLIQKIIKQFSSSHQVLDIENKHLPYVFMGSFASLVQSLSINDVALFRESVEIMNEMACQKELEIANLLQVGVLEILCDSPNTLRNIVPFANAQLIEAIKQTRF